MDSLIIEMPENHGSNIKLKEPLKPQSSISNHINVKSVHMHESNVLSYRVLTVPTTIILTN